MVGQAQQPHPPRALPAGDSAPWRFAEWVAGSLLSPGRTLREVGQQGAIIQALVLVVLLVGVSVSGQLAAALATFGQEQELEVLGATAGFQITGILWNVVWGPVYWTITAALLFGIAYLLGGRGSFQGLWAATGFALTPQFLASPLAPLTQLATQLGPGWQVLALVVSIPIYLATFVWTVVLLAIAVRETMNVSGGRAFGAVALLIGAFMLLAILMICLFVLFIVGVVAAVS